MTGVSKGTAVITAETYNGKTASHTVEVLENAVYIEVRGFKKGEETKSYILPGAEVRIGNCVKLTNEEGIAHFERSDLPDTPTAAVTIDAGDDYVEKTDEICLILNTLGRHSFTYYVQYRTDEIYIKSASVTIGDESFNLIDDPGMKYIPFTNPDGSLNKEVNRFDVTIDWNRYKDNPSGRKIWLEGVDSGYTYALSEGNNYLIIAGFFDLEEPIKLVATTRDEKGREVRAVKTLPLMVKLIDLAINVPSSEAISLGDVYFLDGLDVKLSLGDLTKFATDMSFEDGILTVDFEWSDTEKNNVKLGILKGNAGPKIMIGGKFKIPLINQANAEWEGTFKFGTATTADAEFDSGDEEYADKRLKILDHDYNFFISQVPCFIETTLSAGGEGRLGIYGTMDKVYFKGGVEANGEATLSGGVGGEVSDDVKITFGPEGTLTVILPLDYLGATGEVDFNPSLEGKIEAVINIELFDVIDISKELKLGGFKWDKNGVKWDSILDNWTKARLSNANVSGLALKPSGRDYLENGGGFTAGNGVALFSLSTQTSGNLYTNIMSCADAEITLLDGNKQVIFTDDNTERDEYNSMMAVYSTFVGSVWSSPVAIDDDGTIDCNISADGRFVAWENANTTLSAGITMEELLAVNDIEAAVWNGEGYDVTKLSEDTVYDYSVKLKSAGDKAVAAWLSNTANDILAANGVTSVNYCVYDGGWSEITTVEDIGAVTNLNVIFDGETGEIVYKSGGDLYTVAIGGSSAAIKAEDIGRYAVESADGKTVLAHFDSEKKLHLSVDGDEQKVIETEYKNTENPIILYDGECVRVFWAEDNDIYYTSNKNGSWSGRLCFRSGLKNAKELDAVYTDGSYTLSYLYTQDGMTNLATADAATGTSFTLEDVTYDKKTYAELGKVAFTAKLHNNGEASINTVAINTEEDGVSCGKFTIDTEILPGETGEVEGYFITSDRTVKHAYSFTAEVNGVKSEAAKLSVGTTDVEISDAGFYVDEVGNEQMCIDITNCGTTAVLSSTVNVYENSVYSEALYSFKLGVLEGGETAPVRILHTQDSSVVYYITVEASGDENDANNEELIGYDRVEELKSTLVFDYETKMLTANVPSVNISAESGIAFVAVYDSEFRLKNLVEIPFLNDEKSLVMEVSLPDAEAEDTVMLMLWSGYSDMYPVSDTVSLTL